MLTSPKGNSIKEKQVPRRHLFDSCVRFTLLFANKRELRLNRAEHVGVELLSHGAS